MVEIVVLALVLVVLPAAVGIGYAVHAKKARDTFDAETPIGDVDELHGNYKDDRFESEKEEKQQKIAEEKVVAEQKAEFVEDKKEDDLQM